ncbi:uncharacterized protein [Gossypium hirsutum]|uniref:Uncharacterized protein isoform X2 n=1 Tax=Gossypium hirsutum TaxID=3635 RepID=A0ABM3AF24_GOSHI|nr:uncharacterized protein LOC107954601 isoform X2 [Gossypium hirsutum]
MLPNQPILLTPFGDGDSEDTIRCTLIHQVINQLPIPGNQRSFQILMQSPFPTRHNIPSLTTSRTLQRLFQFRSGLSFGPCFTLLIHASVLPKIHRLLFLPSTFLLHSPHLSVLPFYLHRFTLLPFCLTSLWRLNWTSNTDQKAASFSRFPFLSIGETVFCPLEPPKGYILWLQYSSSLRGSS